jgi:hypothetical protein
MLATLYAECFTAQKNPLSVSQQRTTRIRIHQNLFQYDCLSVELKYPKRVSEASCSGRGTTLDDTVDVKI